MKHRLIGNWSLVSYDAVAPDGTRSLPFGEAVGRLSYDEHGHMSGQVMRPGRSRVSISTGGAKQVRAAYIGYIAYFGRYEISPAGDAIVHHVDGALNPAWVGGEQRRQIQFDGDLLILQADVLKNHQKIRHVLTWRKLP